MTLCPAAASEPFQTPTDSRRTLLLGYLSYQYAPNPTSKRVFRRLEPIWTTSYVKCMQELYPSTVKHRPPPVVSQIPETIPPLKNGNLDRDFMTTHYNNLVSIYADGRPEGALYIILNLLHEIHNAVLKGNQSRFGYLVSLYNKWSENGSLEVSMGTHGLTHAHEEQLRNDYLRSQNKLPLGTSVYTHESPKEALRRRAGKKLRDNRIRMDPTTYELLDKDGRHPVPTDPSHGLGLGALTNEKSEH